MGMVNTTDYKSYGTSFEELEGNSEAQDNGSAFVDKDGVLNINTKTEE